MPEVRNTLAACLFAHADAVERFGTDRPELVDGSQHDLIGRLIRQRQRAAALDGDDPEALAKHVESLTKGMRIAACSRKTIHAG
jgi:hypothetical protein